jgi:adenosylhomocysteinase
MLTWPDGSGPDLLVDDGGDATLLIHKGVEFATADERARVRPRQGSARVGRDPRPASARTLTEDPGQVGAHREDVRGVSEETTTGVHRLYEMEKAGTLLFPAINVNDSVTKSKFDNLYGCRHSVIDGLNRATDVMLSGKIRASCSGTETSARGARRRSPGQGARVHVTEIDPICALQAPWRATRSCPRGRRRDRRRLHHGDGQPRRHHGDHMARMKDKAIVANIGHFDNEIDMAGLASVKGIRKDEIKPQYHEWTFPDGHSVLILAEGRLMNLGCATGHPSFVMSASFTNQVIAQIELARTRARTRRRSTCCRSTWTRRSRGCTSTSWGPGS